LEFLPEVLSFDENGFPTHNNHPPKENIPSREMIITYSKDPSTWDAVSQQAQVIAENALQTALLYFQKLIQIIPKNKTFTAFSFNVS